MSQNIFRVFVADNARYRDDSAVYEFPRTFSDLESAIAACKQIVDDYLADAFESGMSARQLLLSYQNFGEDPYISGPIDGVPFSAWTYAKEQCPVLVAKK